jgi:hypothetical protein
MHGGYRCRSLRWRPSSAGLSLVNEAFGYRSQSASAGYKLMPDWFCSFCAQARPVASIPRPRPAADAGAVSRRARLAVHPPAACSGIKTLPNTSCARRISRQAPLAFRSLDALRARREADRRRRDEERPFSSEQRTADNKTTITRSATRAHPGNVTVTIDNRRVPTPRHRIRDVPPSAGHLGVGKKATELSRAGRATSRQAPRDCRIRGRQAHDWRSH